MLTYWNKLLNTDCTVVEVGTHTVYPIFRVGYTTLTSVCDKKYVNEEIANCNHIDVMIRDPRERFVSGVNEYCRQHDRDVRESQHLIQQGKLVDRHFAPQYMWLLHLSKFYKKDITIRPFEYIRQITTVHANKSPKKTKITICEKFVKVDRYLTKLYNQTVSLSEIVKRYKKNVLS